MILMPRSPSVSRARDPLPEARGIFVGMLAGTAIWLVLGLVVWLVWFA